MIGQYRPGIGAVVGDSTVLVWRLGGLLLHFVETAHIIRLVSTPLPPFAGIHIAGQDAPRII
jgi:hypothetical protein